MVKATSKPQTKSTRGTASKGDVTKFIASYLQHGNATRAAIEAGYSERSAHAQGCSLLKRPEVVEKIRAAKQATLNAAMLTDEMVITELKHSAFLDPVSMFNKDGSLLPLSQMPESTRRAIAGIEVVELFEGRGENRRQIGFLKKIKLVSKEGMLTLAARHLGMLHDNLTVDGSISDKLEGFSKRMDAAKQAKVTRGSR